MAEEATPVAIVVMGPSGTGKTTTARLLADKLDWPYVEADGFHPETNIEKMSNGTPLDDDDRQPWLEALRDHISSEASEGRSIVLACSALKRRYRDILRQAKADVRFVNLTAAPDVILDRMSGRSGHFMPPSLLKSQFETLEPLETDEDGCSVSVLDPPDLVAEKALAALDAGTVVQDAATPR